jgi:electron transport complex protein RnfD
VLGQPPILQVLYGAVPGGIGETSAFVIVLAGLYLIHRNYVRWILPASFIASAAIVLAVAPVFLDGPEGVVRSVWMPIHAEGWDVGFTYLNYQLWGGELLLAAFFLAPEMTSRPVTAGGQLLFGIGCGVLAMLLQLYALFPLSCYVAVLVMNTFTPLLERITRPRVIGTRPLWKRLLGLGRLPARRAQWH